MTESPAASSSAPSGAGTSPLLVVLGIIFIIGWFTLAITWGGLTLMASLMANDSGKASADAHMLFLVGVFGGQILTALAGIFGGFAIFWRGKRRPLWLWFAVLFVIGALLQGAAAYFLLNAQGLAR